MYRLHCFAQSGNSYKVALMLNLAGLPWEPVFVDYFKGETRGDRYRSEVNEMGEVPVLEIGGKRLTQSGIILDRLARETGKFAPHGEDEREECWRWMLFDNHKFTSYLRDLSLPAHLHEEYRSGGAGLPERSHRGRSGDCRQAPRAPAVSCSASKPTIADISMAGYVFFSPEETGFDFAVSHQAIEAWRNRIKALAGWKHPYDLMPGHPLPQS